jgi:hypothetical protein
VRYNSKLIAGLMAVPLLVAGGNLRSEDPTYEQAVARWPDLTRPITFLGCKDHPDEFGVMWNGNLTLASATMIDADRRLFRDRKDDSLQVSFSIGDKPEYGNRDREDGSTEPSLSEGYLPITEVKIRNKDVVLQEEAFASDAAGNCVAAAWNDPAYLRLRFTVQEAASGASPIRLWAQFAKNHTHYAMREVSNVRIEFVAPLYGRTLRESGNALLDSQDRVVMLAEQGFKFHPELPPALNSIALRETQLGRNLCEFTIPRRAGAAVEMIIPFLAGSPEKLAEVRRLGFAQARQSVAKCWANEIAHGMQVEVPEEALNNLWRFTIPLTFMTADSYPNGDRVLKISSHHYEAVWATPAAMNIVDLIQRGYRDEAAAYLGPLLAPEKQQPVPNTGDSFSSTKGFLGGPRDYVAINWVSDNGATLWAAAEYYLVTRDDRFLARCLPTLLESLEWISRERARTRIRGGPDAGLLPAGRGSDADVLGNFFFNDAWNYRGLAAVCRVLNIIGHKDAERWARERDDYRATFQKAFREQVQRTVRWRDASGAWIPFIPTRLDQISDDNPRYFYLDTGPMMLGVAGLIDPSDEAMTWAMQWLADGPESHANPDWYDWSAPAFLRFEMSSLEPCYSWNVYLRFLRGEREKFLEGFYSLAAGSVTRKFLGGVEHRNGIQALPVTNAVIDSHLRNMLVFENEDGQGIDLLRNSPTAWLRPEKRVRVERAETYFGPMSYRLTSFGARVEAVIESPSRTPPRYIRLWLNHPEGKPLSGATVNGVPVAPSASNLVEIKNPTGTLKVIAQF